MKRGEVYWADLVPRPGSEQTGRRPVVVMSHDAFNRISAWMSIIVIPLSTSTLQARRGPTVVAVPAGVAGLPKASSAICHQITTLDRNKLVKRIGVLTPQLLRELEDGLRSAVDLD